MSAVFLFMDLRILLGGAGQKGVAQVGSFAADRASTTGSVWHPRQPFLHPPPWLPHPLPLLLHPLVSAVQSSSKGTYSSCDHMTQQPETCTDNGNLFAWYCHGCIVPTSHYYPTRYCRCLASKCARQVAVALLMNGMILTYLPSELRHRMACVSQ